MVGLLILLGLVLVGLTIAILVLVLRCKKTSCEKPFNKLSNKSKPRSGLGAGAQWNSTTPSFVGSCRPEIDLETLKTSFQGYTPFSIIFAPMDNSASSYTLVSAGLQRQGEGAGTHVAVLNVHKDDGSIDATSSYAKRVANKAFVQCKTFCPSGYTEKEVDGEFVCVSDTGGPSKPVVQPNNCQTSYMNVKQIFWNPIPLPGTKTPTGFLGVGPCQPDAETPILPRTNRQTAFQNGCADTAGNLFGGIQISAPWVFGQLHGEEDQSDKLSSYGLVLNGTQLMVAYPGEEDWLDPSSLTDPGTMGWGLVGGGVDVPQGDGPVVYGDKGTLRMDVYFMVEEGFSQAFKGKTLWSDTNGALFGHGTLVDLRLENGCIWVVFASTNLTTYLIRFTVTSSSGILGLDSTSTIQLDSSFGGGKGFLGLVTRYYVDMMVQYLPVPSDPDVYVVSPGGADKKNVLNRVGVIASFDHANNFELWGVAWNATAFQPLKTSIQKCITNSSIPICLVYSTNKQGDPTKYHDDSCTGTISVPYGKLTVTKTYCRPDNVTVVGTNWVTPLIADQTIMQSCSLFSDYHPDVVMTDTRPQHDSISALIATPPFWMAPLGYSPLVSQQKTGYSQYYMTYLSNFLPGPSNRVGLGNGWGYTILSNKDSGEIEATVKAVQDYTASPAAVPEFTGGLPSPASLPRRAPNAWKALGYQTKTAPPALLALYSNLQTMMTDSLGGNYLPYLDIFYI